MQMTARTQPPGGFRLAAILCALAALLLLYAPVFGHAWTVWSTDEEFSFGYLVPPIALFLLWQRRATIARVLGPGSNVGLLGLLGGSALYLADIRSGVHVLGGVAFILAIEGAMAFLFGLPAWRATVFPLTFLAFGLCLYRGLLNSLGFALQRLTAVYAAHTAGLVGVPVRREGVDLFVGHFQFVVAQSCSGLSSLLALLCLGTLLVGISRAALPRRLLLVVLIVPIVLVANIVRVALVLVLSQRFGMAVAEGFVHSMFSITLFLAATVLMLLIGGLLGCYARTAVRS